mmetsp:Transcript_27028/g.49183  ORF Transcript_27028/g.49183 Transcript_27028/m.49183 type:complete len:285 (-) Transcript_27028:102-956(-)
MGTPSSVGVNDDLASSQAGISLRSTDDELSRWVDVEVASGTVVDAHGRLTGLELDGLQSGNDNLLVDEFVHFFHGGSDHLFSSVGPTVVLSALLLRALGLERLSVLSGDDNGVDLERSDGSIAVLLVLNGDLSLSVGAQPPQGSVLADIGEDLSQLGGHHVGQGHAVLGLIGGVAKHDSLVSSTHIQFGLSHVNASRNIGGLLVDAHQDLAGVAAQSLGIDRTKIVNERVESDLTDLLADDSFVVDLSGSGNLSKDHHHVVLGGSLAGNLGVRVGLQASIQDGI